MKSGPELHVFCEPLPGTALAIAECRETVRYSETIAARGYHRGMNVCRDCLRVVDTDELNRYDEYHREPARRAS